MCAIISTEIKREWKKKIMKIISCPLQTKSEEICSETLSLQKEKALEKKKVEWKLSFVTNFITLSNIFFIWCLFCLKTNFFVIDAKYLGVCLCEWVWVCMEFCLLSAKVTKCQKFAILFSRLFLLFSVIIISKVLNKTWQNKSWRERISIEMNLILEFSYTNTYKICFLLLQFYFVPNTAKLTKSLLKLYVPVFSVLFLLCHCQ